MKSFKDALTKSIRAGVNELNAKRIILNKINVSFIVDFLHYVNQIFIITYKVVLLLILSNLILNNLQQLIFHETKLNQTNKQSWYIIGRLLV